MADLAGIVDLRDSTPMQDLQTGMGLFNMAASAVSQRNISIYNRRKQIAEQNIISRLKEAGKKGIKGEALLDFMLEVPNATDTQLGQELQQIYVRQKIGSEIMGSVTGKNYLQDQLKYWQQSLNRTIDPLGDIVPGQEEMNKLASQKVEQIRLSMMNQNTAQQQFEKGTAAPGSLPYQISPEEALYQQDNGLMGPPAPESVASQQPSQAPLSSDDSSFWEKTLNLGKGTLSKGKELYQKATKKIQIPSSPSLDMPFSVPGTNESKGQLVPEVQKTAVKKKPMTINGQTEQQFAKGMTQLSGKGDPERTPGTPEFKKRIESLPKEKRMLDRKTAEKIYYMLKAQNPGLSQEELIKLAEETAIQYGWILE